MMRRAILLTTTLLLLTGTGAAAAPCLGADACPAWRAERDVKEAKRALVRAEKRLAEAKRVLSATRSYSGAYGTSVGRWTRLSRRVGWPWAQFPTLMLVIDRESGGHADAKNPASSASGLLQLMSIHWAGKFDPMDPQKNLAYGLKLWRGSGWTPWAL